VGRKSGDILAWQSINFELSFVCHNSECVHSGPTREALVNFNYSSTYRLTTAAAELTTAGKIVSVAGGSDTVAALNAAGTTDRMTYVSAAGGAFLEWLEGKPLPGVQVLRVK
jgi:phosphoglycerate kinase